MSKPKFVIVDGKGMFFDNGVGVWRNEYADATKFTNRNAARRLTIDDARVAARWDRIVGDYGRATESIEFQARREPATAYVVDK